MKTYALTIRGKHKEWSFVFESKDHLDEWEEDGLDVGVLVNTVPEWVVRAGLVKPWCFLQRIKVIPL